MKTFSIPHHLQVSTFFHFISPYLLKVIKPKFMSDKMLRFVIVAIELELYRERQSHKKTRKRYCYEIE